MAEGEVPHLVLGKGSPKSANVPPAVLAGHACVLGTPLARTTVVADLIEWAVSLGAGVVAVDLDGQLAALMVERALGGQLGALDVRLLTPSSPVGIPVSFKPFSALSSSTYTEEWRRLKGWLPSLQATLSGIPPESPDHQSVTEYFMRTLDAVKADNPSILTVQGLVSGVRDALASGDAPVTQEVAEGLVQELSDLGEDLRNAALAYGAPVDLVRLVETPLMGEAQGESAPRPHVDIVLLEHLKQVAERNSIMTALLLEVYAWMRLRGQEEKLMVLLPEVESPTDFIAARPFAQRLARRVLGASAGTGLLGVVLPTKLEDPAGLPPFGVMLIEKEAMEADQASVEALLGVQGIAPSDYARMGMLAEGEWALAGGQGWTKWHRFAPDPASVRERAVDTDALGAILPTEAREVFKRRPAGEVEGEEVAEEEAEEEDKAAADEREAARAARAVEDAEDLLSYTERRVEKKGGSRIHQEVQELLKRKLEEKEREKEARKFELKEIDLVEGDEEEVEAEEVAPPPERRPLASGTIDDDRGTAVEAAGAPVSLHADDLQAELEALAEEEAERSRRQDLVVDLDSAAEGWEGVSPEVALSPEEEDGERPRRGEEGDEEEDLILEVPEE